MDADYKGSNTWTGAGRPGVEDVVYFNVILVYIALPNNFIHRGSHNLFAHKACEQSRNYTFIC